MNTETDKKLICIEYSWWCMVT